MDEQTRINWLSLAFTYGVGPATMLRLVQYFGSATSVLQQDLASLQQVVSKGVAASILSKASQALVDKALAWEEQSGSQRQLLTLLDQTYPGELAQVTNPPLVLFAEGDLSWLERPKVAVVGTRHPTPQGVGNAQAFAGELSRSGITVVSGLAAGIDKAAHEGALAANSASTIAVVGTGIDIIYPASNRSLYQQIREQGLLLSEFNLGSPPTSTNFPRRNRVIVGLTLGCLVVESAVDGGSMLSANLAVELGREVFAIPGSIHNPQARGCHQLLKQGAKLVETTADILDELRLSDRRLAVADQRVADSDHLLVALGHEPQAVDVLAHKLNLEFAELCGKLLELELAGEVANCGGGRYQRIFK